MDPQELQETLNIVALQRDQAMTAAAALQARVNALQRRVDALEAEKASEQEGAR